jgi:hypothetical protein
MKVKPHNELKSKLAYLKRCELILKERIIKQAAKDGPNCDAEYVETVKMFIIQKVELWHALSKEYPDAIEAYEREFSDVID